MPQEMHLSRPSEKGDEKRMSKSRSISNSGKEEWSSRAISVAHSDKFHEVHFRL